MYALSPFRKMYLIAIKYHFTLVRADQCNFCTTGYIFHLLFARTKYYVPAGLYHVCLCMFLIMHAMFTSLCAEYLVFSYKGSLFFVISDVFIQCFTKFTTFPIISCSFIQCFPLIFVHTLSSFSQIVLQCYIPLNLPLQHSPPLLCFTLYLPLLTPSLPSFVSPPQPPHLPHL